MNARCVIVPAMAAVALGCGAATDSRPVALDAALVNARFAQLDRVLESAAWRSFGALGPVFAASAAARLPDAGEPAIRAPRIPEPLRGVTFVLLADPLRYVPDPSRTGAPVTGVRILLYAENPVTGAPDPTREIGYADLTDEGDSLPTGVALRLVIVSENTTWVEYAVAGDGTDSTGMIAVTGFVSDRATRVAFDIGATNVRTAGSVTMDLGFSLGIAAHQFDAVASVRNVHAESGTAGAVDLDLMVGATSIGFDATGVGDSVTAAITVDRRLFATIRAGAGAPVVRGADGGDLTPDEVRALTRIMSLNGVAFEMFEHLMRPVGSIVELDFLP